MDVSEREIRVEPADLAGRWPLPEEGRVHQERKRALEGCRRKMVVLDLSRADYRNWQYLRQVYRHRQWCPDIGLLL